ncbi:MAG: tRNA glutamyl-Q(34) synthetase GluQRS [Polyangiales bacterium]
MRGRFAPSPTGDLHLGGAFTALAACLRARESGGMLVVRMEDLDPPRTVAGAADRILDDLGWLGLDGDEGPRAGGPYAPYVQSARNPRYAEAIDRLRAGGLVYPCTCSRAEIARASSAPHAGEEGPRYPGTCRDPKNRRSDRPAALRLRVPDDARRVVAFVDVVAGAREEDVAASVGDFVLQRADGVASYQLAVVVDDLAMGIDEVVRGDDLLPSTARQILLARLLGGAPPRHVHLPMVRGPDGERLAKRHQSRWRGSTIAELRADGLDAEALLGELAAGLGLLAAPRPSTLAALTWIAEESWAISTTPWTPSAALLRPRE